MIIERRLSDKFKSVVTHVKNTSKLVDCSGAAIIIIQSDKIVTEKYWGKQSKSENARLIQPDTQFHVASVRKSYIGFAVAYAIHKGSISSIDDPVEKYLPFLEPDLIRGTTIRHLLTHTHGLLISIGEVQREFLPESNWAYRGTGIDMLTQIVKITTGKTVSEIVLEQVFEPLNFKESGWYGELTENLVDVIRKPNDQSWYTSKSTAGDKMNMYVSARELAKWGYLHLKQGCIDGKQAVTKEIINLSTSLISPKTLDSDLPQNGYLWFVKDLPSMKTEIGGNVPKGSYQILGYTGVTLLVIPKYDIVAVRAFNSFGSPNGYDYLSDVRSFGDTVISCK
ncbi:serine hydrolase domain-containing protein [Rummeliibacillus pycnus]|uniref:serine hydrolase domain-containing protein n=1 Tax=Rummeliibacillus pycnus TaxID=101070 RepID=UPI0037C92417